ncbi:hypothetical protein ACFX5U_15590 [Sphingobacterium sp. SG20118]|uniref:hypothetical protein n=1 Tax=Sphingobacterium sp. SG20118 TaxID=3367156 RepID=UPI0037DFC411
MPWYKYNGGDVCNPNSYTTTTTPPTDCLHPNNFLCAIQSIDNLGAPIITPALCLEIANAVNNRTESTNVLLKP